MLKYIISAQLLISSVYYLLAIVIGTVVAVITNYKNKNKKQLVVIGLIVAYLVLVLSSTVITRTTTEHNYELMLFWSYVEIYKGNKAFIYENILNVLMLMPIGVLVGIGFKIRKKHVAITGVTISLTIEILQLLTRRGLFEFDDILHNSIGCVIGYVMCRWVGERLIGKI